MSEARSDLCEVSPISQRKASTRLDLPQPFGPTTPVRPGSIMKSVGSTNDLKPWRRRCVSFMNHDSLLAGRESSCRDNTMEGNVGVVGESLPAALMGRQCRGRGLWATAAEGFSQGFSCGFS